ncbi:sulfite exporter TauE/SafE family protein [Marinobacter arenosus]|uniref:sulfite exporter TauE/SafE family protein n=1 Tax=Marinobacter arenosus TaxID=2856822 RepID=UPI001C4AA560|nr:sulfite exporter TauE/SafE family protein [Marinobacter arenosus]MBW0146218.1 sulfite exporter TauE/SafE family protein [Marinobacter arenosus]
MESETLILLAAALISGFSKFSVGGMGMLIVPVLMLAYPGPEALGILVPIYIVADLIAIFIYRKAVNWSVLIRLLPLLMFGMGVGAWFLAGMNGDQFALLIGLSIVGMLLLGIWLDHYEATFMRHPFTAKAVGFVAGVISMTASAAGPILSLYIMEQRLEKESYVSTRAWLFLVIDLAKVPLLYQLGFVNAETTWLGLQSIPGMLVGGLVGYLLLSKMQFQQFKWLIRVVSAIAAVKIFLF